MKKRKYEKALPRRMYSYFTGYAEAGAPSFSKFARSIGATLADIERWREKDEFMRAYRECSEIRRDYLIDTALSKRADASLVKFLLSTEYGEGDGDESGRLDVTIEVQGE